MTPLEWIGIILVVAFLAGASVFVVLVPQELARLCARPKRRSTFVPTQLDDEEQ